MAAVGLASSRVHEMDARYTGTIDGHLDDDAILINVRAFVAEWGEQTASGRAYGPTVF